MATVQRKYHDQNTTYIAKRVTYSDAGISAGTLEFPARLPPNCFILSTSIQIRTAFNAGTTNVLTVGTVSGTAADIVTASDVNEGATGITRVAGVGVLSKTAEKQIFVKYAQTGTAASAGEADIIVEYADMGNP